MKQTRVLLGFAVVMSLSGAALAAPAWTTNWDTITSLESFGDDVHVQGITLSPNPGGCANTTLAKVRYSLPAASKKALASVLTSAFLANREVKLRLDDVCEGSYPAIIGVQIQ